MRGHYKRPWGINAISSMIGPANMSTEVFGGLLSPVRPVPEPYWTFGFGRLRAAWWVLSGRAHAVIWPKAGDLEAALNNGDGHA